MNETAKKDKITLNIMIVALSLMMIAIIGDNIHSSLTGALSDRQNYEQRKKYYEETIIPTGLELHPAEYYIKINE